MTELAGLRRALETRPTIDLAKGMVMQRYGCTDVAAFGLLRRFSQEHNVKIRDLAAAIVARVDEADSEAPPAELVPIAARLFQGPDTDSTLSSVDGAGPSDGADRPAAPAPGHGRGTD